VWVEHVAVGILTCNAHIFDQRRVARGRIACACVARCVLGAAASEAALRMMQCWCEPVKAWIAYLSMSRGQVIALRVFAQLSSDFCKAPEAMQ
jgi:hypothetical protein